MARFLRLQVPPCAQCHRSARCDSGLRRSQSRERVQALVRSNRRCRPESRPHRVVLPHAIMSGRASRRCYPAATTLAVVPDVAFGTALAGISCVIWFELTRSSTHSPVLAGRVLRDVVISRFCSEADPVRLLPSVPFPGPGRRSGCVAGRLRMMHGSGCVPVPGT